MTICYWLYITFGSFRSYNSHYTRDLRFVQYIPDQSDPRKWSFE